MVEMHVRLRHRIPSGVSIEVQISGSIRWLAGGVVVPGISDTTFYCCLHASLYSQVHHPRYELNFPLDDADELENMPNEFLDLGRTGCFDGCVGALDGLTVAAVTYIL